MISRMRRLMKTRLSSRTRILPDVTKVNEQKLWTRIVELIWNVLRDSSLIPRISNHLNYSRVMR